MNRLARQSAREREDVFLKAAEDSPLSALAMEKDFWVCFVLSHLFTLENLPSLTFKGATSLTKGFGVLKRFSEDIDVSISRSDLGFRDEKDPSNIRGTKGREKALEELRKACITVVRERFKPTLQARFAEVLGGQDFSVVADPDDPDEQTLLFQYPLSVQEDNPYLRKIVKIEFGGRSDHWPVEDVSISPYVSKLGILSTPSVQVQILSLERTFWEKATLLHQLFHKPESKRLGRRLSRHYYDVVMLHKSPLGSRSLKNISLLSEVARHKMIFFRAGWAKYDEAKPGTLRLVPHDKLARELKEDYEAMSSMFFEAPPNFDDLLGDLKKLEAEINSSAR